MNVTAAKAVVLSGLISNVVCLDAIAADGTIYIKGAIVMSTADPAHIAVRGAEASEPQHTTAERSLLRETDFELLDYYIQYMHEHGVTQSQLRLQTSIYE